jgi:hypothetical protein
MIRTPLSDMVTLQLIKSGYMQRRTACKNNYIYRPYMPFVA